MAAASETMAPADEGLGARQGLRRLCAGAPGMYGLMFRTRAARHDPPSLTRQRRPRSKDWRTQLSLIRNEKAYRRGAGSTVARPGRRDCADVVAGVHGFTTLLLDGRLKDILHGCRRAQRRPTATCDAALDRRAAAGARAGALAYARRTAAMSNVIPQRMTARVEGDFVVFLIGMRINKPGRYGNGHPSPADAEDAR